MHPKKKDLRIEVRHSVLLSLLIIPEEGVTVNAEYCNTTVEVAGRHDGVEERPVAVVRRVLDEESVVWNIVESGQVLLAVMPDDVMSKSPIILHLLTIVLQSVSIA